MGWGKKRECIVRVQLPDDTNVAVSISGAATGQELMEKLDMSLQLAEKNFFGIKYSCPIPEMDGRHRWCWLAPHEKISAQAGHPTKEVDEHGQPILMWAMRLNVKYYVGRSIIAKWSHRGRRLLFHQLARDISQGRFQVTEDTGVELAGYACYVFFGRYNPETHDDISYIAEHPFLPAQDAALTQVIHERHQQLRELMSLDDALEAYLELCQLQEFYGVELHMCRNDIGQIVQAGVSPRGILLYRKGQRQALFPWNRLKDISYKNKAFKFSVYDEISVDVVTGRRTAAASGKEQKITTHEFVLPSNVECKELWTTAVQNHTFFRRKRVDTISGKNVRVQGVIRDTGSTVREAVEVCRKRSQERLDPGSVARSSAGSGGGLLGPATIDVIEDVAKETRHSSSSAELAAGSDYLPPAPKPPPQTNSTRDKPPSSQDLVSMVLSIERLATERISGRLVGEGRVD